MPTLEFSIYSKT